MSADQSLARIQIKFGANQIIKNDAQGYFSDFMLSDFIQHDVSGMELLEQEEEASDYEEEAEEEVEHELDED